MGLQTDIVNAVAQAIRIQLSPAERARLDRRRLIKPEAYDAYLRARYYESGAAGLATERTIETYKKAVELDPSFTAARAGLARAYIFGVGLPPKVALATARQTAIQAEQLDPGAPEAIMASAITRLYYEHDFTRAEEDFRRAISIDPGNSDTYFNYSQCLAAMGRFNEALSAAERAQRLDPLSPLVAHYIGRIHYFARQYDRAREVLHHALDIDENYAFTHIFLATTYERLHQYDRALESRQAYLTSAGTPLEEVAELGQIARTRGYKAAMRRWAERAAARAERRGYVTSSELTQVYLEAGDREQALHWLQRAVGDYTRDLIYLKVEPSLDPLRGDPRFEDLIRRVIH